MICYLGTNQLMSNIAIDSELANDQYKFCDDAFITNLPLVTLILVNEQVFVAA